MERQMLVHPFEPLFDENSEVLILGSFPSVKSREQQFYYGHPQNRFWLVIAALLEQELPVTVDQKKKLILSGKLALWDTVSSCEITGSSDASIRNVKANDLNVILDNCSVRNIYCNGKTSWQYYRKLIQPIIRREAVCLPSTSPANAQWTLEKLIDAWSVILRYCSRGGRTISR